MKAVVELRNQSNDQLNNRLSQIEISLRRIRGYNHGACKEPGEMSAVKHKDAKQGASSNTMLYGKLRKEKARILTILNERRNKP